MDQSDKLLGRFKRYAVTMIRLYVSLPKRDEARVIGNQMLRSATSPGAHYAEARRSRSRREYISKIEGALQEIDETAFWLGVLVEAGIKTRDEIAPIETETDELTRILVTIVKSAKSRTEDRGRRTEE